MKKILIITSGFFPAKKYGGPPVSVDNFCTLMKGEMDCYIVTKNHDLGEHIPLQGISKGWNDRGNVRVLYLSSSEFGYAAIDAVIEDIKPDYIYLQSLFSSNVPMCLKLAKKHDIKTVLAPRGELCAGALKKKFKKLPYIALLRMIGWLKGVTFQSTSDEETQAISKFLGAPKERIYLLTNIPSIPHMMPERSIKEKGIARLVFISRILWKKNLSTAISFLRDIKGNVLFDIYGPKEDEHYWKECEEAMKQLPSNVNVNYCGVLAHDEIHETFCKYDAFLFPTLSENYGHVIAESLVTRCIPIISDQTPWNDMNEYEAGWAISLSEEDAFVKALQNVVDMDEKAINVRRNNIDRYLQYKLQLDSLKQEYMNMFQDN